MSKTFLARLEAVENSTMTKMFAAVEHELSIMPESEKRRLAAESDEGRNFAVIYRCLRDMLAKHGLLQALDVLKDRVV